jgi:hypothetical protein
MNSDLPCLQQDASGGVDLQHQSIALVETDFDRPETLTFKRFDTALGNLNAVIITCESRIILSGSVRNQATTDRAFGISVSVEMAVATTPSLPSSSLLTAPAVSAIFSLPAGASANIPWNAGVDQKVALFTTPADLALFVGTSPWKMHISTVTKHTLRGGGGAIASSLRAKAGFDAMVQYEFTPAAVAAPVGRAGPRRSRASSGVRA